MDLRFYLKHEALIFRLVFSRNINPEDQGINNADEYYEKLFFDVLDAKGCIKNLVEFFNHELISELWWGHESKMGFYRSPLMHETVKQCDMS